MPKKRKEKKVTVLGSGNGGTAVSKIISVNTQKLSSFQDEVTMYVYEEIIDDRKLTDIINETHENVKYLPGKNLGANVVAVADLMAAVKDSDYLVFTFPYQKIATVCAALFGKIRHSTIGLVMLKGFGIKTNNSLELASRTISDHLKIQTCILTGFPFPSELLAGKLSEITVGCSKKLSPVLKDLIETDTLRVRVVDDMETVEICSSLKTLVACGAGIADGLGQGYNCKAAIFRIGLIETVKFLDLFYPSARISTVFESTNFSDLLLACFYGRERRVSEALVASGMTLQEAEQRLLNGVTLVGAKVAKDVYTFLRHKDAEDFFPLFTAVHRIFSGELKPQDFLPSIRSHPEHILRLQRITW